MRYFQFLYGFFFTGAGLYEDERRRSQKAAGGAGAQGRQAHLRAQPGRARPHPGASLEVFEFRFEVKSHTNDYRVYPALLELNHQQTIKKWSLEIMIDVLIVEEMVERVRGRSLFHERCRPCVPDAGRVAPLRPPAAGRQRRRPHPPVVSRSPGWCPNIYFQSL